ncbi:hypothetical protein HMPREF1591_00714 [Escherichia coli 113303]|nr:hypothetical protein HMPREF1591_00714 [Escherichia coli 113303]
MATAQFGLWRPVLISGLLQLPTAGYVATPNPAKDSCPYTSACAFTTTIRALRGTFHQFREVCGFNALTCCANKKATVAT